LDMLNEIGLIKRKRAAEPPENCKGQR
jgi:hypothetical protein